MLIWKYWLNEWSPISIKDYDLKTKYYKMCKSRLQYHWFQCSKRYTEEPTAFGFRMIPINYIHSPHHIINYSFLKQINKIHWRIYYTTHYYGLLKSFEKYGQMLQYVHELVSYIQSPTTQKNSNMLMKILEVKVNKRKILWRGLLILLFACGIPNN